jgi:hypothetical protein
MGFVIPLGMFALAMGGLFSWGLWDKRRRKAATQADSGNVRPGTAA